MESIGKSVWELKTSNESTWYRLIYLTRVGDAFYVLHAFEKSSRKTDRRDLEIARSRLKLVLAQLRMARDGPDAGVGSSVPTVRDRLPADLRAAPSGPDFGGLPFTSLYLIDDEWAAEIANRTVHGVVHFGWVPDPEGGYRGQMAVLVKRNGLLGAAYMATIRPFRHLIVYPRMMRDIERGWRANAAGPPPARA